MLALHEAIGRAGHSGCCVGSTNRSAPLPLSQLGLSARSRGAQHAPRRLRLADAGGKNCAKLASLGAAAVKLKRNQFCLIHHSRTCCGREQAKTRKMGSKWETVRAGVRRIRDEHARHPDGYRYKLSPAELNKVLIQKVRQQNGLCAECEQPLLDMNDVAPDHFEPRGNGGCWRDDRPENIRALHSLCNFKKGSQRR